MKIEGPFWMHFKKLFFFYSKTEKTAPKLEQRSTSENSVLASVYVYVSMFVCVYYFYVPSVHTKSPPWDKNLR